MDKSKNRSFLWMFPVVLGFAFAVFGIGLYLAYKQQGFAVLAGGCASIFVVLAVWCMALFLHMQRQQTDSGRQDADRQVADRLQDVVVLLTQISEQQLITERAKTVAFRESERDAFRRAIREEIGRHDYEAALALISDIENLFGYRQEAERFRDEVRGMRDMETRRQVQDVSNVIDMHCRAELWSEAVREAEKLMATFPDDPAVQRLPDEIESRRQAHKKRLLDNWNDAIGRHDVDGSIEILKQLDLYLTPAEAEALREPARMIFKDKLQILGQQFTFAVRDHHWTEAIGLGETIMKDFPNSRMAQEVRDKIDLLREKASGIEPAAASN